MKPHRFQNRGVTWRRLECLWNRKGGEDMGELLRTIRKGRYNAIKSVSRARIERRLYYRAGERLNINMWKIRRAAGR